jgi:hypothetical protein
MTMVNGHSDAGHYATRSFDVTGTMTSARGRIEDRRQSVTTNISGLDDDRLPDAEMAIQKNALGTRERSQGGATKRVQVANDDQLLKEVVAPDQDVVRERRYQCLKPQR